MHPSILPLDQQENDEMLESRHEVKIPQVSLIYYEVLLLVKHSIMNSILKAKTGITATGHSQQIQTKVSSPLWLLSAVVVCI